jgi:hypothetical protein
MPPFCKTMMWKRSDCLRNGRGRPLFYTRSSTRRAKWKSDPFIVIENPSQYWRLQIKLWIITQSLSPGGHESPESFPLEPSSVGGHHRCLLKASWCQSRYRDMGNNFAPKSEPLNDLRAVHFNIIRDCRWTASCDFGGCGMGRSSCFSSSGRSWIFVELPRKHIVRPGYRYRRPRIHWDLRWTRNRAITYLNLTQHWQMGARSMYCRHS